MKEREIIEIIEDRFKTLNKLLHKVIKEFNTDDIHDFRVEIKKLRAFLRLLNAEKEIDGPLIPKLLKTFYGYVGIIRNIQLHRHSIFKYITDCSIEEPKTYIKILDSEKSYWKNQATELMGDNNFKDNENEVLKQLPGKLEKPTIKKFAENKLDELKKQLTDLRSDAAIHNIRKILKDILYNWAYLKAHIGLPGTISKEEDLKLLTMQLGNFRDKCIQLEFLSDEYLDKVKNKNEKAILIKMKDEFEHEKQIMIQQLTYNFDELSEQ